MAKYINPAKVVTGVCRFSYANLWEAKAMDENSKPKYSVSLIIPKSDTKTIEKIRAAIQAAYEEGQGKLKGNSKSVPALTSLKTPLRDGDLERPDDEAYANSYFVNANSITAPGIVDAACQPILEHSEIYSAVYGSIDTYWRMTDEVFPLAGAKLLAPCVPKQIICVGFNYRDHAREFHVDVPKEPALFTKAAHTVIGNDGKIIYPRQSHEVVYEAELGVVIKKRMKDVAPEDVPDYILGYTCANDVTARDLQLSDVQWLRSKSFDTFCPLGPWLETDLDPTDLSIKLYLNGQLKQNGRTSDMVYNPYEILSYISQSMTLDAGDLILTGTPMGCGPMLPGDEVVVEIEGIGKLRNEVVKGY